MKLFVVLTILLLASSCSSVYYTKNADGVHITRHAIFTELENVEMKGANKESLKLGNSSNSQSISSLTDFLKEASKLKP